MFSLQDSFPKGSALVTKEEQTSPVGRNPWVPSNNNTVVSNGPGVVVVANSTPGDTNPTNR